MQQRKRLHRNVGMALLAGSVMHFPAHAELNDLTQTPNTVNEGIAKSLTEQIGLGRGDLDTPDSSMYIIKRDPFRSIRRGRQLFQRKFRIAEGLGPRTNDGIGDINTDGSLGAGLADSCGACHGRPRGSAGFGGDVFTHPDSRDAPHLFGLGLQEMLADEITADLRAIRDQAVNDATNGNTTVTRSLDSKGINYGNITAFSDGSINTDNIEGVNEDLRVRPFFAEGSTISIREFSAGAFNAEMGLESSDKDLNAAAAGADIVTPAGMILSGSVDSIEAAVAHDELDDPDNDGVVNEVPDSLIDHMEFYLLNYFAPATYQQGTSELRGKRLLNSIGCTECHVPELRIENDRRVAHVTTEYDPENGIFNRLFATATPLFTEVDDGSGHPTQKLPQGNAFVVENFYADMKRHDLGPAFWERNFDGTYQKEFMTEPLWGVGSTAPYGHDGRSINLTEVILRHGGEAEASKQQFERLGQAKKQAVLAFLNSLVLFPPDDTASNLNPGD
ncbi:MAG: di-heme oxidoredictase family protein, partial [bacterium]